jgi:hypothetical protein
MKGRSVIVAVVMVLGLSGLGWAAPRFTINDRNPEAELPSVDERVARPREFERFVQDLLERAALATKRGDHLAAARYYSAVARVLPDRVVGFSGLCRSLEALGEGEGAIEACGDALAKEGLTADDVVHHAHLVLGKSGPLSRDDRTNVEEEIRYLRGLADGRTSADQLSGELAARSEPSDLHLMAGGMPSPVRRLLGDSELMLLVLLIVGALLLRRSLLSARA